MQQWTMVPVVKHTFPVEGGEGDRARLGSDWLHEVSTKIPNYKFAAFVFFKVTREDYTSLTIGNDGVRIGRDNMFPGSGKDVLEVEIKVGEKEVVVLDPVEHTVRPFTFVFESYSLRGAGVATLVKTSPIDMDRLVHSVNASNDGMLILESTKATNYSAHYFFSVDRTTRVPKVALNTILLKIPLDRLYVVLGNGEPSVPAMYS
jgi:hypothetical protein